MPLSYQNGGPQMHRCPLLLLCNVSLRGNFVTLLEALDIFLVNLKGPRITQDLPGRDFLDKISKVGQPSLHVGSTISLGV